MKSQRAQLLSGSCLFPESGPWKLLNYCGIFIFISLFCWVAIYGHVAKHPRTLWVKVTILLLINLWVRNLGRAQGVQLTPDPRGVHWDPVWRPSGGWSPCAAVSWEVLGLLHVASVSCRRACISLHGGCLKRTLEATGLLGSRTHTEPLLPHSLDRGMYEGQPSFKVHSNRHCFLVRGAEKCYGRNF